MDIEADVETAHDHMKEFQSLPLQVPNLGTPMQMTPEARTMIDWAESKKKN